MPVEIGNQASHRDSVRFFTFAAEISDAHFGPPTWSTCVFGCCQVGLRPPGGVTSARPDHLLETAYTSADGSALSDPKNPRTNKVARHPPFREIRESTKYEHLLDFAHALRG